MAGTLEVSIRIAGVTSARLYADGTPGTLVETITLTANGTQTGFYTGPIATAVGLHEVEVYSGTARIGGGYAVAAASGRCPVVGSRLEALYLTGDAYAYLGTNVGLLGANLAAADDAVMAMLATVASYIDTEVAAIKAKTDNLPASPANEVTLGSLVTTVGAAGAGLTAADDAVIAAIAALNNISAAQVTAAVPTVSQIWTTALTEAYKTAGATGTAAQLLYEILANLTDFTYVGTTKTARNLAGTAAKTYTLDSASTPTAMTETT